MSDPAFREATLAEALGWAKKDVSVFPCGPVGRHTLEGKDGSKLPATGSGGFHNATTDVAQINAWFGPDAPADYNLAISPGPAGWTVLDVDPKNGGDASFDALESVHGPLIDTYAVQTPSGGFHFYFKGATRCSASELGAGLDTRSTGGYVLVPPSRTDAGAYRVVKDVAPAPIPDWMAEKLSERKTATAGLAVTPDLPENIAGYREFMSRQQGVSAGKRNDEASTFIGYAFDFGVSKATALPILYEWGARCSPPIPCPDEKIENHGLWLKRQNTGSPLAISESFEDWVKLGKIDLPAAEAVEPAHDAYPPSLNARELANGDFPRPAWLIERLILEAHVNLLVGDGKVGKTYAVEHMVVAVAAGIELWGLKCRQAPVLMVLAEDDNGETKARLLNICAALGVTFADLPIETWCLPGYDLTLARVTDNGGVTEGPFLKPLLAKIVATGARFVVLDPLSDFADLDETKRLAANAYCKKVLGPISHKLGVTVVQTGHPSKTSMADGSVVSGSTAWKNAVRNVLSMERMKDAPRADPRRILRNAWTNYGEERELELHLAGDVLYPAGDGPGASDVELAAARDALIHAVVVVAIKAAETGKPINGNTKRLADVQLEEIRAQTGSIPSNAEVKEALAAAVWKNRLSCLTATAHRKAGYYPADERAIELAIKAKRAARADAIKLGFLPPSLVEIVRHD